MGASVDRTVGSSAFMTQSLRCSTAFLSKPRELQQTP